MTIRQSFLVFFLGVGAILLLTGLRAASEQGGDARADLEREWVAVSFAGDWDYPDVPSEDEVKTGRLVLNRKGFSRYEFREGKVTFHCSFASFRVNSKSLPKAIDFLVVDDGKSPELVSRGIYELKGDTLRICRTIKLGGERPSKFAAEKGSGRELSTWKRQKP